MDDKEPDVTFEVCVSPGRDGTDPHAPDWEVRELHDGVVQTDADVFNNMTFAEAHKIASMWSQKKAEAEAEGII